MSKFKERIRKSFSCVHVRSSKREIGQFHVVVGKEMYKQA